MFLICGFYLSSSPAELTKLPLGWGGLLVWQHQSVCFANTVPWSFILEMQLTTGQLGNGKGPGSTRNHDDEQSVPHKVEKTFGSNIFVDYIPPKNLWTKIKLCQWSQLHFICQTLLCFCCGLDIFRCQKNWHSVFLLMISLLIPTTEHMQRYTKALRFNQHGAWKTKTLFAQFNVNFLVAFLVFLNFEHVNKLSSWLIL